jgi:hypothetical protein
MGLKFRKIYTVVAWDQSSMTISTKNESVAQNGLGLIRIERVIRQVLINLEDSQLGWKKGTIHLVCLI